MNYSLFLLNYNHFLRYFFVATRWVCVSKMLCCGLSLLEKLECLILFHSKAEA